MEQDTKQVTENIRAMGKKKEILSNLNEAVSLLYSIEKNQCFGDVRRTILVVDHLISKAAMMVDEGEKKQHCERYSSPRSIVNSDFSAKIDDTTAFGCPHRNHNKHRVSIDGLSHNEALLIQKMINNLLK